MACNDVRAMAIVSYSETLARKVRSLSATFTAERWAYYGTFKNSLGDNARPVNFASATDPLK
jgi:hypothetical protein